jgi:hypothetical protein
MTPETVLIAALMLIATGVGSFGVYRAFVWLVERSQPRAKADIRPPSQP